jgi:hypothetical protein
MWLRVGLESNLGVALVFAFAFVLVLRTVLSRVLPGGRMSITPPSGSARERMDGISGVFRYLKNARITVRTSCSVDEKWVDMVMVWIEI